MIVDCDGIVIDDCRTVIELNIVIEWSSIIIEVSSNGRMVIERPLKINRMGNRILTRLENFSDRTRSIL